MTISNYSWKKCQNSSLFQDPVLSGLDHPSLNHKLSSFPSTLQSNGLLWFLQSPCSPQLYRLCPLSVCWNLQPQVSSVVISISTSSAKPSCTPWYCSSSIVLGVHGNNSLPSEHLLSFEITYYMKSLHASSTIKFMSSDSVFAPTL